MIRQYAPKGKEVPILSGEWGYSIGWKNFDEARQAKYLARQWLTNVYAEVPVSIWYDWHDDGRNPKEPEHHFGTVHNVLYQGREPVYDPKPSYLAAKALTAALGGYRYNKRLAVGDPASDFVLLFDKGGREGDLKDLRLAVWTTSTEPHPLAIPASPGAFHVVDHLGAARADLAADDKGLLTVSATDAPLYLTPAEPNNLLRLAAAVERVPLDTYLPGGREHWLSLRVRNPLAEPIRAIGGTTDVFEPHLFPIDPGNAENIPCRAYVYRDAEARPLTVRIELRERCIVQQWTSVIATNPLALAPLTPSGGKLMIRVDNPSAEAFDGVLFLTDRDGGRQVPSRRLSLDAGQKDAVVQVPFPGDATGPYRFGLRVEDRDHNIALKLPPTGYRPVDDFARLPAKGPAGPDGWRVAADGDAKVASEQSLTPTGPQESGLGPATGSLELRYRFGPGHKFLRVEPTSDARRKIDGQPRALGLWIDGDGKGGMARIRFTDATGQTFQPDGGRVAWQGWRYVTFPLAGGTNMGHWGGANDGTIHYPIRLDTLLLLDNVSREKTEGTIYLASPVWVYP
jgi:hypothetical protein